MDSQLAALDPALDEVPGTVSVWFGRPGDPPSYARAQDATHYAASVMKVAILAALYRESESGRADLAEEVEVRNEFASAAAGGGLFGCDRRHDSDDAVWQHVGERAPLGWLAERMIVRSSNLATNLILARIGLGPVAQAWRAAGARHSVVARGIDDTAASAQGVANVVTASDLAGLLSMIALGAGPERTAERLQLATASSCHSMINTLLRQERTEDLVAGLPVGTPVAHKNGWVAGIRHAAGIVFPDDAPPFVLVVCLSTELAENRRFDGACQIVARIATAAWSDRLADG